MDGLLLRFVHHQLDAFETKDVCDLMRVNEHASRAARSDRTHKFGDSYHARFNMHVTIQKSGDKETSFGVNNLCLFSNGMTRIRTDICDMTIYDGDVCIWNDLP